MFVCLGRAPAARHWEHVWRRAAVESLESKRAATWATTACDSAPSTVSGAAQMVKEVASRTSDVVVRQAKGSHGFNDSTEEYEDLMKAGMVAEKPKDRKQAAPAAWRTEARTFSPRPT
jgi:hypothetical protein